jgi:DNA-binding transcriptional regulator YiaG
LGPIAEERVVTRKKSPAEELRDLIAACGMSQREAAQALDRTQRMVEYWLSGDHAVPRTVLLSMRYLAEHPEAR